MEFTRRKTLLTTGGVFSVAGCIDSLGDDTNGTGNGNGTSTDDSIEYDVFQPATWPGRPLWRYGPDTGFISLFETEEELPWMPADSEEIDGLESWLKETDFEQSKLIYIESAGPNTCYTEFGISDIGIEDGTIVGTAEAADTSGDNEECGQTETHPSAFVRVTDPDLPSDATFTITDGWGESSEVAANGQLVDPEFLPGGVTPPGETTEPIALTCNDESFERHRGPTTASLGEVTDENGNLAFAMRVQTYPATGNYDGVADEEPPVFERGDEVRVTMWNVSNRMQYTGNRHKYSLQVLAEDGWQDVRGTMNGETLGYTDEAIAHGPGEGFEWAFEMTEEGVLEGHVHEDRLEVCPDLQAGRYRFVYHEANGEPLAVKFDYEG